MYYVITEMYDNWYSKAKIVHSDVTLKLGSELFETFIRYTDGAFETEDEATEFLEEMDEGEY